MKWIALFLGVLLLAAPCRADSAPPNSDPHAQLNCILHRPMFQAWQLRQRAEIPDFDGSFASRIRNWMARPLRAIRDFLEWIFTSKGNRNSSPSISHESNLMPSVLKGIAWTAVAIVLVFAGILLLRIMYRSPGKGSMAQVLSRRQITDAMEAGDALALGTAQWMEEARRLADEENFRAVYRALYLALLSGLHTAGKIEHNRNRTNWTYVQHYRGPVEEKVIFGDLTGLFDRVWYGRREAGGTDIAQLRAQVASLTASGGTP